MKKLIALLLVVVAQVLPLSIFTSSANNDSTIKEQLIQIKEDVVNETGWKLAQYEYRTYLDDLANFPASFTYNGKKYKGFNEDFSEVSRNVVKEDKKEKTTINLKHNDGLDVILECSLYISYGAYDWTIYFENNGSSNSAIIENINACDISFRGTNPILKGMNGDQNSMGYPFSYNLLNSDYYFTTSTGRASEEYFPYFNLETDTGGTLIAIGWPGRWTADFKYSNKNTSIVAGQKNVKTYLKSGESLRTPLMAFVRYGVRDEDLAMNCWRKWYMDCNMPKDDGEDAKAMVAIGSSAYTSEMVTATEDIVITAMNTFAQNGIKPDYWWMDAGWYTNSDGGDIPSWQSVGTWDIDTDKFPTKLKAVSDNAHDLGIRTLLWFEPETIRVDINGLVQNYGFKAEWAIPNNSWGNYYMTDFANPEFRAWLLNKVNTIIKEADLDHYRSDFNIKPAESWNRMDEENRVGLYENQYICGYLDYWDQILISNPGITIDSCASGGNRNDLETLRRSFIYTMSDSGWGNANVKQSMLYQAFKWFPYFGTITDIFNGYGVQPSITHADKYMIRSTYCPLVLMLYYYDLEDCEYQTIYDCINEWRGISNYVFSDYYTLTPYSRNTRDYIGWEFFDNNTQCGYFELYRREDSTESSYTVKLKGLEDNKTYLIQDFDSDNVIQKTGKELKEGLTIKVATAKTAYLAKIIVKK